ncbi:MAG: amidohydrolase family protein [Candidatus Heimdallarchaeota archaeon]|nr:amidohydrolase family protein [Candidatus Heimdallarchaeota archaeon]
MSNKINAEYLIIGSGEVIKNGAVVFEGTKVTYAGESEHAPNADNVKTAVTVMPGMWDCHTHFTGIKSPSLESTVFVNPLEAVIRTTWDVKEMLLSGFTSTREVGGMGIYLNRAISDGIILGPRIYGAGKILSITGGHADIHNLNLDALDVLNHVSGNQLGELVDGVPECYRGVRKQLRSGAEVIKYCASGGVLSEIDHPIHQQFSDEEQKAIVEEASRAQVAVAAHCHGAPGIEAAIKAGVTTIEHGSYLNAELADSMVENGTILVATRYAIEKLFVGAEKMGVPTYAMDKLRGLYDQHREAVKIAIKKGVTIAMGTDMFTTGPDGIFRYGDNALELEYLVDMGMSPSEAIVAATKHSAMTIGKKGVYTGVLEKDFDADLLVLNSNPLNDIKILQNRENITNIVKQGIFVK